MAHVFLALGEGGAVLNQREPKLCRRLWRWNLRRLPGALALAVTSGAGLAAGALGATRLSDLSQKGSLTHK